MSMMSFGPAFDAEVAYRTERLRAAAKLAPLTRHVGAPGARVGAPSARVTAPHADTGGAARAPLTVRKRGIRLRRRWYLRVSGAWHAAR